MSAVVYRLAVWRELRRTLREPAEVAELALEAERIADRELRSDSRRWHEVRRGRVPELAPRMVVT